MARTLVPDQKKRRGLGNLARTPLQCQRNGKALPELSPRYSHRPNASGRRRQLKGLPKPRSLATKENCLRDLQPTRESKSEPSSSWRQAPKTKEADTKEDKLRETPNFIIDKKPPRKYGFWTHGAGDVEVKPWALILFSGKSRPEETQHALCALGWRVCAIDLEAQVPTHLLDDAVWTEIQEDLMGKAYAALWIATPCETFSPLREKQPGPRVLRTLEHIKGLPRSELTPAQQKQVKESNILVYRSVSAANAQTAVRQPWGMESPDHPPGKPSIWLIPYVQELEQTSAEDVVKFDQCRTGLATTKPTKLLTKGINLRYLNEIRCDHELREFKRSDGSSYKARHEPKRWTANEKGALERASKSQGQYTAEFSMMIAKAFHETQEGKGWLRQMLGQEGLP